MGAHSHSETVLNIFEKLQPKKVVEIGTWAGWLTDALLSSDISSCIKEYWAVDQWRVLPDGYRDWSKMTLDQWDDLYITSSKLLFKYPNLRLIRLPSIKAATLFPDGYFDFIYVDADHYYEPCQTDIKAWLPKLGENGIIAGHDYFNRNPGRRSACYVKSAVDDFFGVENIITEKNMVWIRK